jgi:hypothetical protein
MYYLVYDRQWRIITSFQAQDYMRRGFDVHGPFTYAEAQAALADLNGA